MAPCCVVCETPDFLPQILLISLEVTLFVNIVG